jgi:hypothetical protein
MSVKIEFVYNKQDDMTTIYVWSDHSANAYIIDKLEMPSILSTYQKKKIREELINREGK